jgi:TRAP-type uncharacterized transport system substrate-binding protein
VSNPSSSIFTASSEMRGILRTYAGASAKAVAAFAQGIITHIDDLGARHLVLARLTLGEMTSNSIPAPFHPAANQIYKALEPSKK